MTSHTYIHTQWFQTVMLISAAINRSVDCILISQSILKVNSKKSQKNV